MTIFSRNAARPRELIESAIEWLEHDKRVALLTLVAIEGSAPYPVGSQMLVDQNGVYLGQITGGCAEAALSEQAKTAILKHQNTVERYGLGSPYFDIQLPCGSGVDVHFDVTKTLSEYREIQQSLQNRKAIEQTIVFGSSSVTKRYLPNEKLLVVGQGPIVQALSELGALAGFDIVCFSDEAVAEVLNFCDPFTALVSLFHEHDLETDILAAAINSNLFYVGALGSQRTHAARIQNLIEMGCKQIDLKRIHAPVGLDIGAVSPEQIAISILAEIIAVMNAR